MVLHVIEFRDAFAGRAVLASRQFRFCSVLCSPSKIGDRFKSAYSTLQATLNITLVVNI